MADRGRVVREGIRFAADVASDPSGVVTLWKAATGGKAIGCLPGTPVPELLHAANLLSIVFESPEDLSLLSGRVDAWLVGADPPPLSILSGGAPRFFFPRLPPGKIEEALDRIEALAEWAGAVSGSPASEGGLWKSIRELSTHRSLLDALAERCLREAAFLTPEERRIIVRAGNFLPPEAHSLLLSSILGIDPAPPSFVSGGERGDPLLFLAKRLM
jgi:hypothetical protein